MTARLTPLDESFLQVERSPVVMHSGSVMIFQQPRGGLDFARLMRHISSRIALAPRYRQRVRGVPFHLGTSVWVDDEHFDLSYHVRRSALPSPGTMDQLADLVARIQPRPLDRNRPLWELYVVEGLEHNRFALITKTHLSVVDGINAVDISHLLLDESATAATPPVDTWRPGREPSSVELVTSALIDMTRRPPLVLDAARAGLGDVRSAVEGAFAGLGGLVWAATGATSDSPMNVRVGEHRRFATVELKLTDLRRVRSGPRGRREEVRVNDVVYAVIAGGLRHWLLSRGVSVTPSATVRILAPHSIAAPGHDDGSAPVEMAGLLIDLPVGEPNAVVRLQQVAFQTRAHSRGTRAVPANRLAEMAAFAPGTMHSLAARVASGLSRLVFNAVVSNVPGPRGTRYLLGGRLLASYPVIPLAPHHGLSIGVTSYRDSVFFGVTADRDAFQDLATLATCLSEALADLLSASAD